MDILSKIVTYEESVFQEYCSKRIKLLENIKNFQVTHFKEKNKFLVFVNDIKAIIDPIKTSTSAIDYYFTNTDFTKTDTLDECNNIKQCLGLYIFLESFQSTETLDNEISDESSENDSESESPRSSISVSETFSSVNSIE